MDLSPRETHDLASFFARRFPDRSELDQLARTAGIELADTLAGDVQTVWSTVIVEASVQGRLRRLARTLAAQDRDDANLQEVCGLILRAERRPMAPILAVAAVGVVVLVAATGFALRMASPSADETVAATAPVAAEVAPAAAPAEPTEAVEPAAVETAAVEAAAVETAAVETAAVAAATAPASSPEPASTEPASKPVRTASIAPTATHTAAAVPAGCDGAPGQVVGYWYAGRTSPGAKGDVITLDQAVNVRADYPDRHNGYDSSARVQCTLGAGARFELAEAPIHVPGDAYWVPLVAGSRLSD
ncbi:MAG: hypothetical protein H6742_22055 [Alphaproteobacteria bacterium]|nr:hypothetical protein [Alphaproteobacteria bacterium]